MKNKFYVDHIEEASKTIVDRRSTIQKKDGTMTKIRRHHMSNEDQFKFREMSKNQGRFVSPYRRGGSYWGIIETLSQLGENKIHTFGSFWDHFIKVMDDKDLPKKNDKTPWESFLDRPRRSESGKSVIEKVYQNISVLQRLGGANPYGMKLAQLNACIDVLGTSENTCIRLRTCIPSGEDIVPLKETSRPSSSTCSIPSGFSAESAPSSTSMSSVIKGAELAIYANTQSIQDRLNIPSIFSDD